MKTIARLAIALVLALVPAARAQLSKADLKAATQFCKGKLHLRTSAPTVYGRSVSRWLVPGGAGIWTVSLLEVSPSRSNFAPEEEKLPAGATEKGVYWVFLPNDAVQYCAVTIAEDNKALDVSVEGLKPKNYEVTVKFVGVKTLDDFKAAFNRAFSRVPLQDEHPDWPADIRKAVAERRLVEGMTTEQAFLVVGNPTTIKRGEEEGKKVETWFPPQELGIGLGLKDIARVLAEPNENHTGLPESLKFVDGKLAVIGKVVKPEPEKKRKRN